MEDAEVCVTELQSSAREKHTRNSMSKELCRTWGLYGFGIVGEIMEFSNKYIDKNS